MRDRFFKILLWMLTCFMVCIVLYMIFPTQVGNLTLLLQAEALQAFDTNVAGRVSLKSDPLLDQSLETEIRVNSETETSTSPVEELSKSSESGESDGLNVAAYQVSAASTINCCILPESSLLPKIASLCQLGVITDTQMLDSNYLLSKYFVVPEETSLPAEVLNAPVLLSKNLAVSKNTDSPVILIYHTHSQEAYADSAPGVVEDTVVGTGTLLERELTARGYCVLHHTGVYDMTDGKLDRDPAYTKALPVLTQLLQENPSIQVIIDLHRDGVGEDIHLVAEENGISMARFMLVNGLCRDGSGDRTDLTNPFREDNLAFALQTALISETYYPGLFRTIYTRPKQYNQQLRSRSMLLEIGAQTNTVAEIRNAVPVIADILDRVLGE